MNANPDTDYRSYVAAAARPDIRRTAELHLTAKMLSEFMYEEIVHPDVVREDGARTEFSLRIDDDVRYEFSALRREFFDFYRVLPANVRRITGDGAEEPDVETFLLDLNRLLSFAPNILAPALREVLNTLAADCHMLQDPRGLLASQWIDAPDAWLEGELFAHPWIVANKSRLGFSYSEYRRFAPESKQALQVLWLAAHRRRTDFRSVDGLQYADFISNEVSPEERQRLCGAIEAAGADPNDYYLLPVHPWQFEHRVAYLFAREFAAKELIYLGIGSERYLPQQSIRTLTNLDRPGAAFLKLPISILNTSVYRGLPAARTKNAPALTQWLLARVQADGFLRDDCRVILLGEFASLNFAQETYAAIKGVPYQYTEMLGVIFRESLESRLDDGERALPLAALLHRDRHGRSVLAALIEASGLDTAAWIDRFLEQTLFPLLHFLYKYGFVFSPHGQNALIALKDSAPTRLVIKDFVDDANLSVDPLPEHADLPEHLYDLLDSLEPQVLIQWIQSGLFVCVFRYLTEILADDGLMSERDFWQRVLETLKSYQRKFPEMHERFDHFDLTAPVFPKLCLNATRLLDIGYADSAERPTASVASMLENPLFLLNQTREVLQ